MKALGLSNTDRAVIIHTDDIGMCQASLSAYVDLVDAGVISAASTMTPCPWFPATAQFCREHPEKVDMGVHITFNSEWRSGYRWGAVSTCDPSTGLLDESGYLHYATETTQAQATPETVKAEISAQVARAFDAGIDVTHIDSHMGTVFYPGFVESYVEIALQHRVPPFLVRSNEAAMRIMGYDAELSAALAQRITALEAQGIPMIDQVVFIPWNGEEDHAIATKRFFDELGPGLTYVIIHPSKDTPELRAILPDGWQTRVAEYQTFMLDEVRTYLNNVGIHAIGWRVLRDVLRSKM
jgi:predicted glycoside hydrolase/deacetylase ChbG (UPF0249 family)